MNHTIDRSCCGILPFTMVSRLLNPNDTYTKFPKAVRPPANVLILLLGKSTSFELTVGNRIDDGYEEKEVCLRIAKSNPDLLHIPLSLYGITASVG